MKNMNDWGNRKLLTLIYIISLLFIVLLFTGYLPFIMTFCDINFKIQSSWVLLIAPLLISSLIGIIYFILTNGLKKVHSDYYITIPVFVWFIIYLVSYTYRYRNIMNNDISIISKAVITTEGGASGTRGAQSFKTIWFRYGFDSEAIESSGVVGSKIEKQIKKGDTILIRYSTKCQRATYIFKALPTSKDLEKFKNDRYFKDGKILEEVSR